MLNILTGESFTHTHFLSLRLQLSLVFGMYKHIQSVKIIIHTGNPMIAGYLIPY